jgi:hypothetical protein
MIEISGALAGASHIFWIVSSNNTIQGMILNDSEQDAVRIEATEPGTHSNRVIYNLIGTDPTGTLPRPNGRNRAQLWAGVNIIVTPHNPGFVHDNFVEFNVMGNCYASGFAISSCPPGDAFNNFVSDNYVGTDQSGQQGMGNVDTGGTIAEGAHDNHVVNNVISANGREGLSIVGLSNPPIFTHTNFVFDNRIGVAADRVTALPNGADGVSLGVYSATGMGRQGYAPSNEIENNIIAYNGRNGVLVWEHWSNNANSDHNRIAANFIYDNGLLGIDLGDDGVTPCDPSDPDSGANQEVNFPIIMQASELSGQTTVSGWVDLDTPPTSATVEVFKARVDPSMHGEGAMPLGVTRPDAAGNWVITVSGLTVGDDVTATTLDRNANSSEFAPCVVVTLAAAVAEPAPVALARLQLGQNQPNPFSASTAVSYVLPAEAGVRLAVFDVAGRLVRVLASGVQPAAEHTLRWDGRGSAGHRVPSGTYFMRLEAAGETVTRKLLLRD